MHDKMLELLRDNVADHLKAAVANTMGRELPFLEQSIFATGLSADSAQRIHETARARWLGVTQALVPPIRRAIDADEPAIKSKAKVSVRLRIGMYYFTETQHRDKSK